MDDDKNCYGGLSAQRYRKLIEDDQTKAEYISCMMKVPETVYRYRKFGSEDAAGSWKENSYWEDDVAGICMFSKAECFSGINDSHDCEVNFDGKMVNDHICAGMNRAQRRKKRKETRNGLEKYRKHLQTCVRIGCFTTATPFEHEMWDDRDFGDGGRAVCFEYRVNKWDFSPSTIPFLPVLYDDVPYDSTLVIEAIADTERYPAGSYEHSVAESRMVCLGFGHTIIKASRYRKEREWRVIVPESDDGKYKREYFNVDHESRRDLSQAVAAVYLGPGFDKLEHAEKYRDALIRNWSSRDVKIYQMINEDGVLRAE